jgi:hypothetical protein
MEITMTSKIALTLTLLASATSLGGTAFAQTAMEGGRKLTATLTGEAEVTAAGVPNQGDLDGTGMAVITVNPGQGRVCYELNVSGIEPAGAAHIHEAPATTTGKVVVTLGAPTDGSSSGCVDVDRKLALEILKDPADYYVNIHNMPFPNGALRGQLAK